MGTSAVKRTESEEASEDPVPSGPPDTGDLARIQEILLGGLSRRTEERFLELDRLLDERVEALEKRLASEAARLAKVEARLVEREHLAALLRQMSEQLLRDPPAAPAS